MRRQRRDTEGRQRIESNDTAVEHRDQRWAGAHRAPCNVHPDNPNARRGCSVARVRPVHRLGDSAREQRAREEHPKQYAHPGDGPCGRRVFGVS